MLREAGLTTFVKPMSDTNGWEDYTAISNSG